MSSVLPLIDRLGNISFKEKVWKSLMFLSYSLKYLFSFVFDRDYRKIFVTNCDIFLVDTFKRKFLFIEYDFTT